MKVRRDVARGKSNMYLRFVVPQRDPDSRVEGGIFRGIHRALYDERQPEWLRNQLRDDLNWFNDNLPVPDRLWLWFKRRDPRYGVCWFEPSATEAIARARSIQWLMIESGHLVEEIHTDRPGTIFYRDDWQIVAQAGPHIPAAFH